MVSTGGPAVVVALGVGALVGGLAGALLTGRIGGSAPSSSALPAVPAVGPGAPPPGRDDAGVELLLGNLIEEVRALRTSLGSARQSAPAAADGSADLAAALEQLTAALRQASSGGAGSLALGRGLTTIDWPEGAARVDLLLERKRIPDDDQRVRPFLLWNYQQVLDHFGPPTAIWPGEKWMYEDPAGGEQVELHFQYGLLTNIY